jgi:hypothetical protein
MQITGELKRIIEAIEPGFFGVIEIGVQGGIPGTVVEMPRIVQIPFVRTWNLTAE